MAADYSKGVGTAVAINVSGCYNKYHRLGGLNNRHPFTHRCGGQKSKIKEPAGLILDAGFLQSMQMPPSCCVFMWLFLGGENE